MHNTSVSSSIRRIAVVIYHSLFVEVFGELFTAALFIHAG